jgi:hypothetical protein
MASLDNAARAPAGITLQDLPAAVRAAPALYGVTLFASALLLFAVQPMFTKMVLPRLGGAPAVWSVAMVFFQAALLAGYAYAHLLARWLSPGRAAIGHLALLALAASTLPLSIAAGFGNPPAEGVSLWLFALFAASIGLPFVALAASAPLLQSWFAASGHPQARNPYVLYAASNLGSFTALIAYPLAIEPLLTLKAQTLTWSVGFAALALMVAAAGILVAQRPAMAHDAAGNDASTAPTWATRARWIALAAIPSGMVIAVTAHLTTDIAAAPFLWVIPLALFLLTFVAVFRERPWISHATVVWLVPFVAAPLAVSAGGGDKAFWLATVLLNVFGFMLLTLLCHGELYARRPAPARLTDFYLCVSVGGVIGGAFAALVAPNVFSGTYEYPLLIAAALLVLPGAFDGGWRRFLAQAGFVLALAAIVVAARMLSDARLPYSANVYFQGGLVLLVAGMLLQRHQPARFFALALLSFALVECWRPGLAPVETVRSFFGVHRVAETADGRARLLIHGTTLHGAEKIRTAEGEPLTGPPEPLTYYYFGSPISEGIEAARAAQGGLKKVASVGLGTGSLACHRRDGEAWTFFEIDPEVIRIARDPALFRFLARCAPDAPIVLGDARLTLEASADRYDLIVLDAFSSDAIPVHLLTREAFAGYLSRLTENGVLVVHISNRHLELAPVLAAVGKAEGLVAYLKQDTAASNFEADFRTNSRVVALARKPSDFGDLPLRTGWRPLAADPDVAAWTDDYSNILGTLWRKKTGG